MVSYVEFVVTLSRSFYYLCVVSLLFVTVPSITASLPTSRCGLSWADANATCNTACTTNATCTNNDTCWGSLSITPCVAALSISSPQPASLSTSRCGLSWADADATCNTACTTNAACTNNDICYGQLSITPCVAALSPQLASLPTSRCGFSWADANANCKTACTTNAVCTNGDICWAGLSITPCETLPQPPQPNPNPNSAPNSNSTSLTLIQTPYSTAIIAGILVLLLTIIIILSILYYFFYYKKNDNPSLVEDEYQNFDFPHLFLPWLPLKKNQLSTYTQSPSSSNLYQKRLNPSSPEYTAVNRLFYDCLSGGDLVLKEVWSIYNTNLVQAFQIYRSNLEERYKNPSLFKKDYKQITGEDEPTRHLQEWVDENQRQFVASFRWNDGDLPAIIPAVHGTDEQVAWSICCSGFATLSSLDAGYYGAGIYMSTSAIYCLPYYSTKKNPAILICFVIPGNVYPVTEDHLNEEVSLMGMAIKSGFQSHYVLVTGNGRVCSKKESIFYNELVVNQDNQVIPGYILTLDSTNFLQIISKFQSISNRELPIKQ